MMEMTKRVSESFLQVDSTFFPAWGGKEKRTLPGAQGWKLSMVLYPSTLLQ
jgi:hypothetical protein